MKEIKINQLTLENFKCHEHLSIPFEGKDTNIYGDNAVGKTTIYDGLTWLLFGKDSHGNGEKNIDIKPLDAQGNVKNHDDITAVEAEFGVDGERISFRRELYELWKTKRGSSEATYSGNESRYFVDGVPVKKQAFDEAIRNMVPEETFRMLTSVSAFAADMKWQDRRNVLWDMAGTLTDQEIMMQDDRFAILSDDMGKLDLAGYRAKLTSQKKGYNVTKDTTPARISELKGILEDINSIDFETTRTEEEEILKQLEEIRNQMAALDSSNAVTAAQMDLREARMSLDELNRRNRDYREAQETGAQEEKSFKAEISVLSSKARSLSMAIDQAERGVQFWEGKVNDLRDEWTQVNGEAFTGGICPTCGQKLPFDVLQQKSAAFEEDKKKRLAFIVSRADDCKKQMAEAEAPIKAMKQEYEETTDAAAELTQKMEEARSGKKPVEDMPAYLETKASVEKTISELQAKIQAITDNSVGMKRKLREQFDAANDQLRFLQKVLAKESIKESTEIRIYSLQADAKAAAEALERIDQMLFLTEEFTRFKASFVEKSVNDLFMLAKFRLFREQANGGLEERCDVVYDGVPYSGLNTGMQINIGIDIINSLSRHYGYRVPLFVDNAESVTRLESGNMQTIRLVVSESDKEIRYEN